MGEENSNYHPWYRLIWAAVILIISLIVGIIGYYYIAKLTLIDSILNSSMILGGMGPIDTLDSDRAKIFASLFALYSGILFLVIIAFLIDSVVN